MSYAAGLRGFPAPDPSGHFCYCDLGCGNGVTVNLLAASFPEATFYGIDFNPEHIANARALAQKAGLENVTFLDASFSEMLSYELPNFDYIALHGVYSWVNGEIRQQIRDVVDRFLNPGGLLYLCYYTHPGASELVPLWKMLQAYMSNLEGGIVTKAKTALDALIEARDAGSRFFRENPYADRYLDKLKKRDTRFFVHEFCNGAFEPQFFSDVANDFAALGLEYAASAKLDRNKTANLVSSRFMAHIDAAGDQIERETRKSFIRNESFRWDIFARRASGQPEFPVGDLYLGPRAALSDLQGELAVGRREIDLDSEPIRSVLGVASQGGSTIDEVISHSELSAFPSAEIEAAIHDLIAGDSLQPYLRPGAKGTPQKGTIFTFSHAVNRAFIEDSLFSEGKVYVASPVTGSAMRLSFINGLFAMMSDGAPLHKVPGLVLQRLSTFDEAERLRLLGDRDAVSEAWVKRAGLRFASHYLPRLVQQKILVPK